jgi:anti-sigma B factor antagonist
MVKIIKPSGILDGTQAHEFRQQVKHSVESGAEIVLVDFADVTFMDSSGLGALAQCLKTVRAAGGQLFVCSLNEQVKMLFELTSMDRVFPIISDRQELEQKLHKNT